MAILVNEFFGGEILYSHVSRDKDMTHYWNRLPSGKELDLTREQFPKGTEIPEGVDKKKEFETTRDYVLNPKFPLTRKRYGILKTRVVECLELLSR